ncbi:helix-turn-helix transcriptional regulator [Hellea balneolensis]|uniref:helix-turn-helix transcriptional regulator n=1 Tax=Hellea balneolensis TaxID=287478 RepID=UPI000410194D|nr:LuxR C-terminal-related transcriptional regulator [Hellea balneolensis]
MIKSDSIDDYYIAPRLEAEFNRLADYPAILIEAPSGFGKTVYARHWAELLRQRKHAAVTWVDQSQHSDVTLNWIEGQRNREAPFWIFVDDAHLLPHPVLKSLVKAAVHSPKVLHVVLIRRYCSKLRFAAFRLQGKLASLDKDDLAFTLEETTQFLRCKKTVSTLLFERFEGWPAAVSTLKSAGAGNHTQINDVFNLDLRVFWELVEEEVLTALPPDCLSRARELSSVEPFVFEDAQDMLSISAHELETLVKVLFPVWSGSKDNGGLHPCVKTVLQRQAWELDPDKMKQLHLRACQYYWRKGDLVTALGHASRSGETTYVCDLIEQAGGLFLWLNEGLDRIRQVMSFTSDQLCEAYPRLMLIKSLLHVKEGKLEHANRCWNSARFISEDFTKDREGGDNAALLNESRVMGSLLAGYGCHSLEEQIALAQPHPKAPDSSQRNEALEGALHTIMCLHALQNGDFKTVYEQAALSESAFEKSGSDYGILYLDFHRGGAAYGSGKLDFAQESYARAEKRRRKFFSEDQGLRFIGKVFGAELDCETGGFLSAKRKLSGITQRLNESEAWFDVYAAAIRSQTYLKYLGAGYEKAAEFLYGISLDVKLKGLKRVTRYVDTLRLELACRSVDVAEAHRLAKKLNLQVVFDDPKMLEYLMWREYVNVVTAHALYLNLCGKAEEAKPYISALIAYGRSYNNSVCEIYGLANSVTLFSDDLSDLLRLTKLTGYILPIALSSKLQQSCNTNKDGKFYADRALEAIARLYPSETKAFTPREREIVRYLSAGLSDKEIALEIDVSVHTVRFHMKNVFKKTGTNDRKTAVTKAEDILDIN